MFAVAIWAIDIGAQQTAPPDRTPYAYARDSTFAMPVNSASIAFTIPQKDLLAENVAYNPGDGSFYVGSTRYGKIVRRTRNGRISDFIPTGRDGLWMVVGMKVDPARNALWVNTSAQDNYIRLAAQDRGRAGLFRYDLNGRLVKRYFPRERGAHFFNDLVVAPNGIVYVTDMLANAIYRVTTRDSLELWLKPRPLTDPNGITVSGDGRFLFVAAEEGITAINIGTQAATVLERPSSVDVGGIDGLYWHRGSLIGVQGWRRNMIQRFQLNIPSRRITSAEVLEANHPMFMNPSTGVVVGDDLYVIANSQFGSFTRDGKLFPPTRLFETVVLRVPLK